jgi:hypothetical protein
VLHEGWSLYKVELTVIIAMEQHCYQLHTQFYCVSSSQDTVKKNTEELTDAGLEINIEKTMSCSLVTRIQVKILK